jgi:glutamate racemase
MLKQGIDTVVLGCTHYPFVIPLIEQIAGPGVRVIDPAPAVARQTERLLAQHELLAEGDAPAVMRFLTSGDPTRLKGMLTRLGWGECPVEQAIWGSNRIV